MEASDPNPQARERARTEHRILVHEDPRAALERRPNVALICTPAATHLEVALQALSAGADLFVEKPLSTSLEGVDRLVERVGSQGRIVQVGYNLRYHPAMRAAREILASGRLGKVLTAHAEFGFYLEKWWPGRDYRDSYMVNGAGGIELLLDVSHEIDLMIWFLGEVEEVMAYGNRLSNLKIQGMDVVKILMRMNQGTLTSLHMDCLQPTYTRRFSLIGEDSALSWDCSDARADVSLGSLRLFDRVKERWEEVPVSGSPEETYLEELRDFLRCASTGSSPLVGLQEGREVLRVVGAIQEAMEKGSSVKV